MSTINITPFTDVLLVLLIIFMILAALVTPPGFEKSLANSNPNNTQQQNQKKNIEVDILRSGVIFVDGQKTDENGIYAVMASERLKRGDKHVDVIGDAKAKYDIIIKVLDAAKDAGLEDVGFVTS